MMTPTKKNPKNTKLPAQQTPQTPISIARQTSTRNFVIIAVIITVFTVLAGGYGIYYLANQNIQKALEVRAQEYHIRLAEKKKQKLEQGEIVLTDLKKADGASPSTFDFITKRVLPETQDFQTLLTVFNTLETKSLVSVESIGRVNPSGSATAASSTSAAASNEATEGVVNTEISLKVTGAEAQITDFLRSVERSARVMDFRSMKLSGERQNTSLSITYSVYHLPKPNVDSKQVPLNEYEANKGSYE